MPTLQEVAQSLVGCYVADNAHCESLDGVLAKMGVGWIKRTAVCSGTPVATTTIVEHEGRPAMKINLVFLVAIVKDLYWYLDGKPYKFSDPDAGGVWDCVVTVEGDAIVLTRTSEPGTFKEVRRMVTVDWHPEPVLEHSSYFWDKGTDLKGPATCKAERFHTKVVQ